MTSSVTNFSNGENNGDIQDVGEAVSPIKIDESLRVKSINNE